MQPRSAAPASSAPSSSAHGGAEAEDSLAASIDLSARAEAERRSQDEERQMARQEAAAQKAPDHAKKDSKAKAAKPAAKMGKSERKREILKLLTSVGGGTGSGAANLLGSGGGGSGDSDIAKALSGTGGVSISGAPGGSGIGGGKASAGLAPAPPVQKPKKEKKIIRLEEVKVEGKVLERFPTLEAPDEVAPGTTFAVQVSLTELKLSPEVQIRSGETTADGKLRLHLQDKPEGEPWTLDVALSAPGFEVISGQNLVHMRVPQAGDSDPALFQLKARPLTVPRLQTELYATFWEQGRFLAKVSKSIAIAAAPGTDRPNLPPVSHAVQEARTPLDDGSPAPDLTLWVLEGLDPSRPGELHVLVQSPHLQPISAVQQMPADLGPWLLARYGQFAGRVTRGAQPLGGEIQPPQDKETNVAMMRGFGRELFDRFAPPVFKEALGQLQDKLGPRFASIQIFTNSPRLPWELMIAPARGTQPETDFLGITYRVARWHISSDGRVMGRPAAKVSLDQLMVVAPEYEGAQQLPSQAAEVASLKRLAHKQFRQVGGTLEGLRGLLSGKDGPTAGVVHFAGHGAVGAGQSPTFEIQLGAAHLDLLAWKGLAGNWGGAHPLVFLNACEVGRAERTAGFVDGWGPAMLEKGASGYIGGLWPLGDAGAADFAERFYTAGLPGHGVAVADALRKARKQFYDTGDPTYLAYVFYGDAALFFAAPE